MGTSARLPCCACTQQLLMKMTIDLNSASLSELKSLNHIGRKKAQQIIDHRPYESLEQLKDLPGIGPNTIKLLSPPQVTLGTCSSPKSSCGRPKLRPQAPDAPSLPKAKAKGQVGPRARTTVWPWLLCAGSLVLVVGYILSTLESPASLLSNMQSSEHRLIESVEIELAATQQQLKLLQAEHDQLVSRNIDQSWTSSAGPVGIVVCVVYFAVQVVCGLSHLYSRTAAPVHRAQPVEVIPTGQVVTGQVIQDEPGAVVLDPQRVGAMLALLRARQLVASQQRYRLYLGRWRAGVTQHQTAEANSSEALPASALIRIPRETPKTAQ